MNDIIPAILVHDEASFRERLDLIEGQVATAQIDVMDGLLVPNTSWCNFDVLRGLSTTISFELHLMVEDPEKYLKQALDIPKISRYIWHVEAMGDHRELLDECHRHGREAGLALSPKTPAEALIPYLGRLDEILVMGVEPGFSGQALIASTVEKTRDIHTRWPKIPLGFDGGVTTQTIPSLREAGVTRFYTASAIFDAPDISTAIDALRNL